MTKLDLALSDAVREWVLNYVANSDIDGATACLLKGRWEDEGPEDHWMITVYGNENIEVLEPELASLGRSLIYNVDGLKICIAQFDLLSELEGKVLDFQNGRLVVVERDT